MKKIVSFVVLALLLASPCFSMTKAELVADLESKSYVNRLVGTCEKPVGWESDIPVYHQSYLEVSGDEALVKTVAFYVLDEGTKDEKAVYITGQLPNDSVTKAVESRTSLESVKITNA